LHKESSWVLHASLLTFSGGMQALLGFSIIWDSTAAWFERMQTGAEKAVENLIELTDTMDEFITTTIAPPAGGEQKQCHRSLGKRCQVNRYAGLSGEQQAANSNKLATANQAALSAVSGEWEDFSMDNIGVSVSPCLHRPYVKQLALFVHGHGLSVPAPQQMYCRIGSLRLSRVHSARAV
jgi:hypothetical protein